MAAESPNNDNQSSSNPACRKRFARLAVITTIGVASLSIRILAHHDLATLLIDEVTTHE